MMRNTASRSNIPSFELPEHRADADHDRELARQETRLREALAKVQALRRQAGEKMQPAEGSVVLSLFAAREAAACRIASLTPREREVLDLVVAGHPSKIIAWELGINQRTIENHRASIMRKTDSKSLPALARLVIAAAWNANDGPLVPNVPQMVAASAWPGSGEPLFDGRTAMAPTRFSNCCRVTEVCS
jgi:DNA-binding CsgD family transcriptional regulator